MAEIVSRDAAGIHAHLAGLAGLEVFLATCHGIIQLHGYLPCCVLLLMFPDCPSGPCGPFLPRTTKEKTAPLLNKSSSGPVQSKDRPDERKMTFFLPAAAGTHRMNDEISVSPSRCPGTPIINTPVRVSFLPSPGPGAISPFREPHLKTLRTSAYGGRSASSIGKRDVSSFGGETGFSRHTVEAAFPTTDKERMEMRGISIRTSYFAARSIRFRLSSLPRAAMTS